ncbi:MAG: hypothetical protein KDE19_03290 [Caldilineaceae bacterium]|nr:hypothetical protein [Caldilineaceae bacterium]
MQNPTTFVLWGDQFEEDIAVNVVTMLRAQGLSVAIVGMTARNCAGKHGIILHPDLTLSTALTHITKIDCVALPCTTTVLTLLDNDPRLQRFLHAALQTGARLLVHQPRTILETSLRDIVHLAKEIIYFANYNEPIGVAQDLVQKLIVRENTAGKNMTGHNMTGHSVPESSLPVVGGWER